MNVSAPLHLRALSTGDILPAREPCPDRLMTLRATIAAGRYRIDAEAIAARLLEPAAAAGRRQRPH